MPRPLGTPLTLALLLILGIALSSPINQPALFLIAAIAACLLALALTWRATPNSPVPTIAFLTAWTCAAAAWGALHLHTQPPDTIARYIHPDRPCLVNLRGQVEEPILIGPPPTGPMAEFFHRPPGTNFRLHVQAIRTRDGWQPASGALLVRISLVDRRLHVGDVSETTGWLKPLTAPRNPGEFDPRPLWQRDDVQARLTLGGGDDWQPAEHTVNPWSALRNFSRQRARTSLLTGFAPESKEASLLDTLLLGSSARPIADIYDNFRQLGLAHLLAISGAHLMILLWFVWWIAKGLTRRPALAGSIVLLVLLSYIFILPGRAAILRAGIMSGLYSLAYLTGWSYRWRQPEPRSILNSLPEPGGASLPREGPRAPLLELWSISLILVLLLRPCELYEPGTQLSFGVVLGLILFAPNVRHWLSNDQAQRIQQAMAPAPGLRQPSLLRLAIDHLRRAFLDFIAASIVALVIAGPIVAYHFQIITPLALPLGLLVAPLVTATLILGYLKMMLSLLLPGVAGWIIPTTLLESLIRAQIDLAAWAANLPATHLGAIHLPRRPDLLWTFAALVLGAAVLTGRFKRRPLLITTAVLLVTLWLALESFLPRVTWPTPGSFVPISSNPSIELTALDLGPGRCLIVQSRQGFSRHTAVINAGSRQWPSAGQRAILPALTELGVSRIDTLILTAPTLEHLSAVIDIAQRITIREAWISPRIVADLEATPESWSTPARLVLAELRRQGVPIKTIAPNQHATWAGTQVRLLDASTPQPADNPDAPFALQLTLAGRSILLGNAWPDVIDSKNQPTSSPAILAEWPRRTSSRSNLADWLRLNPPAAVLRQGTPLVTESLYWQPIWSDLGITELTPRHQGAVQVTLTADSPPRWTIFLPPGHLDPDEPEDLADQDDPTPAPPGN